MELKEFTKKVLKDLIDGVEEVRKDSSRDLRLTSNSSYRTVEFDVAVTVESELSGKASGGIKVLSFFQVQGDTEGTTKNFPCFQCSNWKKLKTFIPPEAFPLNSLSTVTATSNSTVL